MTEHKPRSLILIGIVWGIIGGTLTLALDWLSHFGLVPFPVGVVLCPFCMLLIGEEAHTGTLDLYMALAMVASLNAFVYGSLAVAVSVVRREIADNGQAP